MQVSRSVRKSKDRPPRWAGQRLVGQATPSAALANAVSAWKKAGGWPLNRLEAVRAAAAACAPAKRVDDGRITEQVGSCSLRKVQRLGKTCDEPSLPSVRSGTTRLAPFWNAVMPLSESRKIA